MDSIPSLIAQIDQDRIERDLLHLSKDPLPCRTMVHTLPGHETCTLYEADDYIAAALGSWGYAVEREAVPVQAYRRDESKPIHHQYSPPEPSDPWYDAYNLYAKKIGATHPDEVIVVISHKDSQSWHECVAGAYDNAVGTVGNMEIARVLRDYPSERSIWFVYCNEEHTPWTSAVTARGLAESDKRVVAALNFDSVGGKAQEDVDAGRHTNVTMFTTPEGEALADVMCELNDRYAIGLQQRKHRREFANDDDGSFVKAGMPAAVANFGSFPYADPNYHLASDIPEHVDLVNVRLATQLSLAFVAHVDRNGAP